MYYCSNTAIVGFPETTGSFNFFFKILEIFGFPLFGPSTTDK